MEAPSDISGGAHQILLALAPAHLLSLLNERVVGGTHPLQEQVMPIQELAVALKQVHGYGQHAPQDVGKAVPQLHVTHPAWPCLFKSLMVFCMQMMRFGVLYADDEVGGKLVVIPWHVTVCNCM